MTFEVTASEPRLSLPLPARVDITHPLAHGMTAAIGAQVGKGKVLLLGPEVLKRAQPHGTFKFLFNGIFYASAASVR